jgi:hypothetical protein
MYEESNEEAENCKMRRFIDYYEGDEIEDVLHETCNTHGRHEHWADYLQNCIQLITMNEVEVLLVVVHLPSLKGIRRAIFA